MEISGVTGAYTSAAQGVEEIIDEQDPKKIADEKAKEETAKTKKKEAKDTVELSGSDFDEAGVEEKANNYVKNILVSLNLTDESRALLNKYMATFDTAKFIKNYGPFNSTAEISAAMFAVTSGLIRRQDDEQ